MIINAGIRRVVSLELYPDQLAREFLEQAGIELAVLNKHVWKHGGAGWSPSVGSGT
jgi:deoxycytidylate deaminase